VKKIPNSSRYLKLTHIQHILLRPDSYIGSTISEIKKVFTVDNINDIKNAKIIYKDINYNQALLKLIDEALVNANDHSLRTQKVTYIKVNVSDDTISVENDGPGIDIIPHSEGIWTPELIFAHLLTSENFSDSTEDTRFWGGRNGLGIKLANIYSLEFELHTADNKKEYIQKFQNNLSVINKPKIKKSKKNFVKITFKPDLERFGLTHITDDLKSVIIKRVFDISAYNPNIKVFYNNILVPIKNFKDYMKLFISENDVYYEKVNEFWEIGISKSPNDSFLSVGLVNGVSTNIGTHINMVSNILINNINDILTKSNKGINIRNNDIKNSFMLFVISKLPNPVFSDQTKEQLTLKLKDIEISESFLKKIAKSYIFDDVISLSKMKDELDLKKELNKSNNKKVKVNKLIDATLAGTNLSNTCQIFITEGDSAASSCLSGFSEIGREKNGIFPLRGKMLNVRDLPLKSIKDNEEIKNLFQILGLEIGKKYDNIDSLRYGKLVLFTDADCLHENTMVVTKKGIKKIKNINYDDYILTHTGKFQSVLNIIKSKKTIFVEININGEVYKFGEYHKIPVYRNNQVEIVFAKDILETDELLIKK
jgi:DNA topoisomerase-2